MLFSDIEHLTDYPTSRPVGSYELTIVIPVFNEEANLLRVETELNNYLNVSPYQSKVLFVNDGSTDGSQVLIETICKKSDRFSFIQFHGNLGLSAALKAGIDYVDTPFVGYIDSDLQTTPLDFDLLMEHRHTHALVTGYRANRKDSFVKNASSKIANGFRRYMTKDNAIDTGCPLKVMQSDFAKRIPLFNGMHRFFPALIMLQNGTVKQVPVRHFPRMAGEAKYHLFNRLIGPFKDCFAFRWMKKRYINYEILNHG